MVASNVAQSNFPLRPLVPVPCGYACRSCYTRRSEPTCDVGGFVAYELLYSATTTYDAEENKNTFEGKNGIYKKIHDYKRRSQDGQEIYCFAEYFIEMPGTWPVKDKDLEQKKNFWPIMPC